MRAKGEETTNKSKHTKNNQFRSRSLRDYRDSCIWRYKCSCNMCPNICSHKPSGIKQGLIASKLRLLKKELTIPRLKLVVARMVAILADNIGNFFPNYNIKEVSG